MGQRPSWVASWFESKVKLPLVQALQRYVPALSNTLAVSRIIEFAVAPVLLITTYRAHC